MPARKTPANWKPRTIALLRKAVETGSVRRAAGALGERREQLIDETIRIAEGLATELLTSCHYVSYPEACRIAAELLEAKS